MTGGASDRSEMSERPCRSEMCFRIEEGDVLALDFDGVLLDSIHECLLTAYNAHQSIQGGRRISGLGDMDPELLGDAGYLRNYIRHGVDYMHIFRILKGRSRPASQAAFDEILQQYSGDPAELMEAFYRERRHFFGRDMQGWFDANPLFPGVGEALKAFPRPESLKVISTKRRDFLLALIRHHGLPISEESVYTADGGISKEEIIESILKKEACAASAFHFIDDQADTVLRCAATGVKVYHARWGYCTEEQILTVERAGLPSLDLDTFIQGLQTAG